MKIEGVVDNTQADLRQLDGIYVPNWFYKEHFENWTGQKLTDKEFTRLKWVLDDTDMCDQISQLVAEYLSDEEVIERIN